MKRWKKKQSSQNWRHRLLWMKLVNCDRLSIGLNMNCRFDIANVKSSLF